MTTINIKILTKYVNGELSPQQRQIVHQFIQDNPNYVDVINGLIIIKEKEQKNVNDYLLEKKSQMRKKLFGRTTLFFLFSLSASLIPF